MKTIKDRLFLLYEEKLYGTFPEAKQTIVRRCADDLSTLATNECSDAVKIFTKLYADATYKSEQHKLLFREHIELISKHSEVLQKELESNSFVQLKINKTTHEKYLVGKTIFATNLINFLTQLNESVKKFYTDVYEVKDEREATELGFKQTSLF